MQYFDSNTMIYVDGQFRKAADTSADIYGQSLHYGYAVFDGLRSYHTHNGTRIFKAREHYERLKKSAELIHIPFKWDVEELVRQSYRLLELNRLKDAYIRPVVFCPPNMKLEAAKDASIVLCAWEWGAYLGIKPLKVCISSYQRPNPKSVPAASKASGNYINSILASTEAKARGFDEALLLDIDNKLAGAPGANLFVEKGGRLFTPPKGNIFPGITRAAIIDLCRILDIELIEKDLTEQDIKNADSAFLCGTATEIASIGQVDDYKFPMKWSDSQGAVLQRTYKSLVLEKQNYEVII